MKKRIGLVMLVLIAVLTILPACAAAYTPGAYEGVGNGRLGEVRVRVVFTEDTIESVEVIEQSETALLADKALTQVPADIIAYQSLGVDTVAGVTFTSRAILNAVRDAVAQAGGDAAALAAVPVEYPAMPADDLDTDILIVGGGTAGLMAACTAADSGLRVTLIEKEDILGGTLNVAAGLLLTVDSEKNDPSIDDSLDRVTNFYRTANSDSIHQPDYDFTAALMAQTGKTVDVLIDMGLAHADLDMGNYVGTMFTLGNQLSADLQAAAAQKGVTLLTGTAGESFVLDDTGAVTGVVARNRSGAYTIAAKKIIIATGGSSWSSDLRESQTQLKGMDVHEKTQIGSTADGIHMLQQIGAKIAPDLYVKSSQPDFAEVFHNDWSNTPDTGMTLMINAEGKRFCNEAPAAATMVNAKMLADGSRAYWNLIDEANTIGFDADYFERIKAFAADDSARVAVYAATLDELAGKLGVDAGTLAGTVAQYNAACAAGEDAEYGKNAAYLRAYPEEGGWYAVYRRVGSWGTIGGAIVDEQQHVLAADGSVIDNVFAAGEVATAQHFGDYYFGGFSLGLYTTAGRIAAETAVAELAQ